MDCASINGSQHPNSADPYNCRSRVIASAIALAFVSKVSMAAIALSATASTPFSESHLVTSSIAAPRACWLCRSNVRASAVAMLELESFDMDSSLIEASAETSSLRPDHAQPTNREALFYASK